MENPPFESFKHGLTVSKIWLCEKLEPHVPKKATTIILGSWYNLLGFMMLTRNNDLYESIVGLDIDKNVIPIADKICEGFMIGDKAKIKNIHTDANFFNLHGYNLVINTSLEHMANSTWFNNINNNAVVCLQCSNMPLSDEPWYVTNPIDSLQTLLNKYPLSTILFAGAKEINYNAWGYQRYMLIGIK